MSANVAGSTFSVAKSMPMPMAGLKQPPEMGDTAAPPARTAMPTASPKYELGSAFCLKAHTFWYTSTSSPV